MKLTEDFVRTVIDSARTAGDWPGSAAHKDFASTVAKHRARSGSYLDFAADLTDGLMEVCERAGLDEALIVSALRTTVPYVVGSAWWADLGFPTITLTPDFQRAAAVTDFGDGGAEPVHLPFPAFLLRLPESLRGAPEAAPCFVYPVPQVVDGAADFHTSRMTLSPDGDLRQGVHAVAPGHALFGVPPRESSPYRGFGPGRKAGDGLAQSERARRGNNRPPSDCSRPTHLGQHAALHQRQRRSPRNEADRTRPSCGTRARNASSLQSRKTRQAGRSAPRGNRARPRKPVGVEARQSLHRARTLPEPSVRSQSQSAPSTVDRALLEGTVHSRSPQSRVRSHLIDNSKSTC